ncbi:hypothetical protein FSARC_10196 [Fusarium sarcochroum]|uniref:Heterokaryon incompatibility domain-containing protein n=1 Tax=Fusarium sarcochroum TaxID=1208366 RepID=A0A8H4TNZ6_9HYPO|nr:hypothetical protein FSARC_10196 [Fusarium sarcochroum]
MSQDFSTADGLCNDCLEIRLNDGIIGGLMGTSEDGSPQLQFESDQEPTSHLVRQWHDVLPKLPRLSASNNEQGCALCRYIFNALKPMIISHAHEIVNGTKVHLRLSFCWFSGATYPYDAEDERLSGMVLEVTGKGLPHELLLAFKIETKDADIASWLGINKETATEAWCQKNIAWVSKIIEETDYLLEFPVEDSSLPTRLIDVDNDGSYDPRLVHTAGWSQTRRQDVKYCALSYCWGSLADAKAQLITTAETIEDSCERIPKHKLTTAMRDAIMHVADDQDPYNFWQSIVTAYGDRKLTHESDRFPAISGIAADFASRNGDTYVAGLWKGNLVRDLLWSDSQDAKYIDLNTLTNALSSPPEYIAPSWSGFNKQRYRELGMRRLDIKLEHHFGEEVLSLVPEVVTDGNNQFGRLRSGVLTVTSKLTPITTFRQLENQGGRGQVWVASHDDTTYARCEIDWAGVTNGKEGIAAEICDM